MVKPRPFRGRDHGQRGPGSVTSPKPRPVLPTDGPRAHFPGRPDWPDPQSQSLSRSYGSRLPISLTHIILSTRGCEPRRPDAEMGTACVETGSPRGTDDAPLSDAARLRETRGPPTVSAAQPPASDPCDFLTCIFHGLALVHGTTQELCRSTATAWFSHTIAPFSLQVISRGPRGLKQKRKLSPGPDASGHKPDPVARTRHTCDPGPPEDGRHPSRSDHR